MVLLIDFAHSWADSWVEQMENGSKCYMVALALVSFFLYAGALTITVLLFVYFTHAEDDSCKLNKFFIGFNVAWMVVITFVSLLPSVRESTPNSGVLQSGVVGLCE